MVQSDTERSTDVMRFLCKFEDAGRLRCDLSTLSVSHYRWGDTPPSEREPNRCHVTSATFVSQVYEHAGLGRWSRRESGLEGTLIETELLAEDGRVSVRDKTIASPCYKPGDFMCEGFGPAGTVKLYKPVTDSQPIKRACSSVVIDPY